MYLANAVWCLQLLDKSLDLGVWGFRFGTLDVRFGTIWGLEHFRARGLGLKFRTRVWDSGFGVRVLGLVVLEVVFGLLNDLQAWYSEFEIWLLSCLG